MSQGDEGAPPPPKTETPPPDPGPSRAELRIQALTAKLREQEERIKVLAADEVTRERDTWKQKATSYEQKLAELKSQHEQAAQGWQTQRTFLERGLVDEEAQVVAQALHSRLPEADRPDLATWMDSWRQQSEDGEVIDHTPAALRPYMQTTAPEVPAPALRRKLAGAPPAGSPGAPAGISPELRARAARGDQEAAKAIREYLAAKRARRA